jgi:hypothetical protein
VEVTEISETLTEPPEHEHAAHHHITNETFRKRVGVFIGSLALALAITSVGGSSAMKQTINANIERSDNYAFYQAKNVRQTDTRLADDALSILQATRPDLPPDAVQKIQAQRERYAKDIEHFDSDEAKGDGKKQLLEKAKIAEEARDTAQERSESFELAEALLQIAIVIASTSILTASRRLLLVSAIFAALGVLGSVNGFLLLENWVLASLGR